jgi:DNA-binding HxlR family transcriptional regulator
MVHVLGRDYEGQQCGLASALEVLGERWTLLIVRDALFGVQRYSDFVTRLDIPRAVLSGRLRSLVANGVLERRPEPGRAGRDHYVLTAIGLELWPAVHSLMSWGSAHRRPSAPVYLHASCGSELAPGAFCPRCQCIVPADSVEMRPRPGTRGRPDPVSAAIRTPRRLLDPVEL